MDRYFVHTFFKSSFITMEFILDFFIFHNLPTPHRCLAGRSAALGRAATEHLLAGGGRIDIARGLVRK
jgi:hypothetical protein